MLFSAFVEISWINDEALLKQRESTSQAVVRHKGKLNQIVVNLLKRFQSFWRSNSQVTFNAPAPGLIHRGFQELRALTDHSPFRSGLVLCLALSPMVEARPAGRGTECVMLPKSF